MLTFIVKDPTTVISITIISGAHNNHNHRNPGGRSQGRFILVGWMASPQVHIQSFFKMLTIPIFRNAGIYDLNSDHNSNYNFWRAQQS